MKIFDVEIDNLTLAQTASEMLDKAARNEKFTVFTPNSEILYNARKNSTFCKILNSASRRTADGVGVLYAAKILGQPLKERVSGYDIVCRVFENAQDLRVYIYGGKPDVTQNAARVIQEKYSGVTVVGFTDGYTKDQVALKTDILVKQPQFLLVCLGSPKQEQWIYDNVINGEISAVCIGAGGSLDVIAGKTQRAPQFWQNAGLEWLYRTLKQPSRIGRVLNLFKFGFAVLFSKR